MIQDLTADPTNVTERLSELSELAPAEPAADGFTTALEAMLSNPDSFEVEQPVSAPDASPDGADFVESLTLEDFDTFGSERSTDISSTVPFNVPSEESSKEIDLSSVDALLSELDGSNTPIIESIAFEDSPTAPKQPTAELSGDSLQSSAETGPIDLPFLNQLAPDSDASLGTDLDTSLGTNLDTNLGANLDAAEPITAIDLDFVVNTAQDTVSEPDLDWATDFGSSDPNLATDAELDAAIELGLDNFMLPESIAEQPAEPSSGASGLRQPSDIGEFDSIDFEISPLQEPLVLDDLGEANSNNSLNNDADHLELDHRDSDNLDDLLDADASATEPLVIETLTESPSGIEPISEFSTELESEIDSNVHETAIDLVNDSSTDLFSELTAHDSSADLAEFNQLAEVDQTELGEALDSEQNLDQTESGEIEQFATVMPTIEAISAEAIPTETAEVVEDSVESEAAQNEIDQISSQISSTPTEIIQTAVGDANEISFDQTREQTGLDTGLDEAMLAQLDQLLSEPPTELPAASPAARKTQWALGIDIGTTGISAVLLNQTSYQLYPLYWQSTEPFAKKQFRLSTTVALLSTDPITEPTASPLPTLRFAVPTASSNDASSSQLVLSNWKPFLQITVPHHSPQTSQWEPVLQWSDEQALPLRTLQELLQQLLLTLNPARSSRLPVSYGALGLESAELEAVLTNLTSVIVGYPSNWSDTYSFNLREAILQAELVQQPEQIVFIEEAIATLLSALPATDGHPVRLSIQSQGQGQSQSQSQSQSQGQRGDQSGHLHNADWQGATLILTAGASLTELVLVNLPAQMSLLNHTDFYVRSIPYAGLGIDQDIIIQMLYPAMIRAAQIAELETNAEAQFDQPTRSAHADFSLNPLDPDTLDNLMGLTTLPQPAELSLPKRHQFQQRLMAHGQQLLLAARALKIALQYQSQFTVQYGDSVLTLERQDLTSQVLLPYIQRLNRELNSLLAQTNTTAIAINQVICTGGTASLSAMARWLRQKLPNATIIQDTYARPSSLTEPSISSCSRVAYGLATLPLHPQVIDIARHRYSDYFLLLELLRALPQQTCRIEAIMERLEQRGIDTQACRFRILALLDGHLPPGLVPTEADAALLTIASATNPDYQAVRLAPLFHKPADRTYEPNRPQWDYLQRYLETLLADTEQTLRESLEQVMSVEVE